MKNEDVKYSVVIAGKPGRGSGLFLEDYRKKSKPPFGKVFAYQLWLVDGLGLNEGRFDNSSNINEVKK